VEQPVHRAPYRDNQPTRHIFGPTHHEKAGLWGLWERCNGRTFTDPYDREARVQGTNIWYRQPMCDAFQQQPCLADAMIDMSQVLSLVHPTSGCKK
jgi:hypothetical protein